MPGERERGRERECADRMGCLAGVLGLWGLGLGRQARRSRKKKKKKERRQGTRLASPPSHCAALCCAGLGVRPGSRLKALCGNGKGSVGGNGKGKGNGDRKLPVMQTDRQREKGVRSRKKRWAMDAHRGGVWVELQSNFDSITSQVFWLPFFQSFFFFLFLL